MDRLASLASRYELIRPLGAGGFGEIYLVRHLLLDALRVVKIPKGDLEKDKTLRELFFREARAANELHHPNIAQLFEFDLLPDSTPYLVMEYVEGVDPRSYLEGRRQERVPLLLEIADQLLDALGYLHAKGLVHRDISPDNIIVAIGPALRPHAKLIDLGIVKRVESSAPSTFLTRGAFLGKPLYASPEQLRSEPIDGRSDLYSLGVLIYELATGFFPFPGKNLSAIIAAHISSPPASFAETDPNETLSPNIRAVLLHAMAKSPEARFQDAKSFAAALREAGCASRTSLQATRIGTLQPKSESAPVRPAETPIAEIASRVQAASAALQPGRLPPKPHFHAADHRTRNSRWRLSFGAFAIAFALVAVRAWHGPLLGTKPGPEPPPRNGKAILDAQPWGSIERIVGADGNEIALAVDRETPLLLELPARSYRVVMSHPSLVVRLEATILVEPDRTSSFVMRVHLNSGAEYLRAGVSASPAPEMDRLERGFDEFFKREFAAALATADSIPTAGLPKSVAAQRSLLSAAARWYLSETDGPADSENAAADVREVRSLAPALTPPERFFSPRFIRFFHSVTSR